MRVLTSRGGASSADVRRTLTRFPATPRPTPPAEARAADEANQAALARELADFRPDAICWWRMAELSMGLLAQDAVPAVGVVCDGWMRDGPERDPSCTEPPDWGRAAAEWLVVSPWLRDHLVARGLPLQRSRLASPGVDPAAFPARDVAPPWRGELLLPGRRSPLKGTGDAVAALAHLPGARLALVGDGTPERDAALREQAEQVALEPQGERTAAAPRVALEPPLPRAELARRMAAADAVLFPVRWDEPWGLVPLEAMSCGVPVVTTATGGTAGYVRAGENALVVPREDPFALAAAVTLLAEDPALRAHLVAGGLHTAAEHPPERASAAVAAALDRVLAG